MYTKDTMNMRTVNVRITRHELCDLILACHVVDGCEELSTKWLKLQMKLQNILKDFDDAHKAEM